MNDLQLIKINQAFEVYRQSIFALQNDIQFWRLFLTISINEYVQGKPAEFTMYKSIFSVYDINPKTNIGYLNSHHSIKAYSVDRIFNEKEKFFNWIINLAVLKAYNAAEILILETISINYFEKMNLSIIDKKAQVLINTKIREYLKTIQVDYNTTNNKHLINYLKSKSSDFLMFVTQSIRVGSKTTWGNFFNTFSLLRHIIAHNGMIVSDDALNEIRSTSKDVFDAHFYLSSSNLLIPIHDQFLNFLVFVNDFIINSVKIVMEEDSFAFLKMA